MIAELQSKRTLLVYNNRAMRLWDILSTEP